MKNLIVYYSFTHNNEMLANDLQSRLHCELLKIETVKRRTGLSILFDLIFNRKPKIKDYEISPENYDECIFIAPVWAAKIAAPLKSFLLKEKKHIKNYSFITICGGYEGQQNKLERELTKILGRPPRMVRELWVNDLLPEEKKNTIRYTSRYSVQQSDLRIFEPKISAFLKDLNPWSCKTKNGPID